MFVRNVLSFLSNVISISYKGGFKLKKKLKLFKNKFSILLSFLFLFQLILFNINNITFADTLASTPTVSYTVNGETKVGNTIEIAINVSNVNDLYGGSIDFLYDPSILEVQSINNGNVFGSNSVLTPLGANGKINNGQASFAIALKGNKSGVNSNGTLAVIKAKVLKEGTVKLNTTSSNEALGLSSNTIRVKLSNSNSLPISYLFNNKDINLSNNISQILTAGKYEETDPNIKYVGSWINNSNTSYSGGSIKYSSTKDNYLEFTFEGTGFKLAQFANTFRGIANINIDGTSYTQDFYSSTSKYKDIAFSKLDLPYGKHTVKISVSGNKNTSAAGIAIAIDYIEIFK